MEFTEGNDIKSELAHIKKMKRKQYRIDTAEHIKQYSKQYTKDNSQNMKDKRLTRKLNIFRLSILLDRHEEMKKSLSEIHERFALLPEKSHDHF